MIFAKAYVFTGMMNGTTLTHQNVASLSYLATKNLNAQSLAFRFTAVLRTTYTFLMCHSCIILLSQYYFVNFNLRKILTVTVQLSIAFSSFLVENQYLVVLQVRKNFGFYLGTFDARSTNVHFAIVVDEQYFVKFNHRTLFCFQAMYIQFLACFCLELLSRNFYNCIHVIELIKLGGKVGCSNVEQCLLQNLFRNGLQR